MSQYFDIQDFKLWTEGSEDIVRWRAPDGVTYQLDPTKAEPGKWLVVDDHLDQPVMAFLKEPGSDGTLVLSLEGAITNRAILVHHEDDSPRKYYYATDAGNNSVLKRRSFILRAEGIEGCPVVRFAGFRVLCLRDKAMPFQGSLRQGSEARTRSLSYVEVADFPSIEVKLKQERTALVTLTVPDTGNMLKGKRNWFAIAVDQTRIAEGVMTSPTAEARIPVTVAAVTALQAGTHTITPQWRVSGGEGQIGKVGTSALTVQLY